jgi:hypothetical protein
MTSSCPEIFVQRLHDVLLDQTISVPHLVIVVVLSPDNNSTNIWDLKFKITNLFLTQSKYTFDYVSNPFEYAKLFRTAGGILAAFEMSLQSSFFEK